MGKTLIIKGADFSANAIAKVVVAKNYYKDWQVFGYAQSGAMTTSESSATVEIDLAANDLLGKKLAICFPYRTQSGETGAAGLILNWLSAHGSLVLQQKVTDTMLRTAPNLYSTATETAGNRYIVDLSSKPASANLLGVTFGRAGSNPYIGGLADPAQLSMVTVMEYDE